jgi:L-amino acid N-acyltransferase YncA
MVRSATTEDAARICEIYNHYVLHSTISFEDHPVSVDEMKQRIAEILTGLPWLVWVEDQVVQGFAHASTWKGRCAYRYSVESTAYLADGCNRRGIGTTLYEALFWLASPTPQFESY